MKIDVARAEARVGLPLTHGLTVARLGDPRADRGGGFGAGRACGARATWPPASAPAPRSRDRSGRAAAPTRGRGSARSARACNGTVRSRGRASRMDTDSSPRRTGTRPGTLLWRAAREMWMPPDSSGSRSTSSTRRSHSGSSSRKSTPWCASEISPGRGSLPPPDERDRARGVVRRAIGAQAPAGRREAAGKRRDGGGRRALPLHASAAAGPADAARASTCRFRAGRSSTGCGRRRPRW